MCVIGEPERRQEGGSGADAISHSWTFQKIANHVLAVHGNHRSQSGCSKLPFAPLFALVQHLQALSMIGALVRAVKIMLINQ